MKLIFAIIILILSLSSCKSSRRTKTKKTNSTEIISKRNDKIISIESEKLDKKEYSTAPIEISKTKSQQIIDYAKQFEGVRYKWGGTTKSGMDCSGLVFESFRAYDVILPRISRDMAKRGDKITLKDVTAGDLLFFKTGNRRNAINHVGLIIDIGDNNIEFIHATTRNGVITSRLNEDYWLKAFVEARRIL